MNKIHKEESKLLDELEKLLNKLDNDITMTGLYTLVEAKQKIYLLKTLIYAEEKILNENEIS